MQNMILCKYSRETLQFAFADQHASVFYNQVYPGRWFIAIPALHHSNYIHD